MLGWIIVVIGLIFIGGIIVLRNFVKQYRGHDSEWAAKNRRRD